MLENLVFGNMIYFEFPLLQFGGICLIYKTNVCLFLSTCEDTIIRPQEVYNLVINLIMR